MTPNHHQRITMRPRKPVAPNPPVTSPQNARYSMLCNEGLRVIVVAAAESDSGPLKVRLYRFHTEASKPVVNEPC